MRPPVSLRPTVDLPVTAPFERGHVFDRRYRILSRLGEGGMGSVYEAFHIEVGRIVALKVSHARLSEDLRLRFRNEPRAVNAIGHPNVVQMLDAGELPDGRLYIAMEKASGRDLAHVLAQTPRLDPCVAVRVALAVAEALAAAHALGIVHRDIKPHNVMLCEPDGSSIKVLDFGVAHGLMRGRRRTRRGEVLGTTSYMAPEQAAGEPSTPAVDVYSFGLLLRQMLHGDPPPGEDDAAMTVLRGRTEPAGRSASVAATVQTLDTLVEACLSTDPSQRPSAQQLVRGLEAARYALEPRWTVRATAAPATGRRHPSSMRWVARVAAGVAASAVLGGLAIPTIEPASFATTARPVYPAPLVRSPDVAPPRMHLWTSPDPGPEPISARATDGVGTPRRPTACTDVEASTRRAREQHRWTEVLSGVRRASCWANPSERRGLQVLALLETGKYEDCVGAARGATDPDIRRWAALCDRKAATTRR